MEEQFRICKKYGAEFCPPKEGSTLGIAWNVKERNIYPINGLRHPPEGQTNGWYIWAGNQINIEDDDFFVPLHISHIGEWNPRVLRFLALPPGWRFLVADDYEDVWFDENLLRI